MTAGLQEFSLTELAAFIGVAMGAMAALMATCFKSRCDDINFCFGAMKCHRVIPAITEPSPEPPQIRTDASENA